MQKNIFVYPALDPALLDDNACDCPTSIWRRSLVPTYVLGLPSLQEIPSVLFQLIQDVSFRSERLLGMKRKNPIGFVSSTTTRASAPSAISTLSMALAWNGGRQLTFSDAYGYRLLKFPHPSISSMPNLERLQPRSLPRCPAVNPNN